MGSYNLKENENSMGPSCSKGGITLAQQSKEDDFKNGTKRLYKSLYFFAITLEFFIIGLGVYAAILVNGLDSISITLVYLAVVSVAEFSKILSVEALARYPSPGLGFFASIALLIAMFFTAENLGNVSSLIQNDAISEISQLNSKEAGEQKYLLDQKSHILSLRKKRDSYLADDTSSNLVIIHAELEDVKEASEKISANIKSIRQNNNNDKRLLITKKISSYERSIRHLETREDVLQLNFVKELKGIEESKAVQVKNAGFRRKDSVIEYFNKRISVLEGDYRSNRDQIKQEISLFRSQISNAQSEIIDLTTLSPSNINLINEQKIKLNILSDKELDLVNQRLSITKQDDNKIDVIQSEINVTETSIIESKNRTRINSEKINKLKLNNWLFKLSSVYYKKDVILVSTKELKAFSWYFIFLGCIGLSLLSPILVIISVSLEKKINIDLNDQNRLWFAVLVTIKELSVNILQSIKSEKRYRKTKNALKAKTFKILKKKDVSVSKVLKNQEQFVDKSLQEHARERDELKLKLKASEQQYSLLKTAKSVDYEFKDIKNELSSLANKVEALSTTKPETKVVKKLIPVDLLTDLIQEVGDED